VRILGIDPGSVCTGWGVIEENEREVQILASGEIRAGRGKLTKRLASIYEHLVEVVETHQPDVAAVEEVFHARNTKSALILGQARGVALLAIGLAGVEIHEYSPRTVKQTVTGHGGADKRQMQRMIAATLGEAPDSLDASDALAVALCHSRRLSDPARQKGGGES